ncbi:hypothetical protein D3C71_1713410 [compost metagenome]
MSYEEIDIISCSRVPDRIESLAHMSPRCFRRTSAPSHPIAEYQQIHEKTLQPRTEIPQLDPMIHQGKAHCFIQNNLIGSQQCSPVL